MKPTKTAILALALLSFVACKKSSILPEDDDSKYIKGTTRVIGVKGLDTSTTKQIWARVDQSEEFVITSDQDSKLKAELIGYQPLGGGKAKFTIRAINLTTCQSIIRWHWVSGLTIDSISPLSDVIHAMDTVVFTLWGDAKAGAITLNSQANNPTSCGNSKTLFINITQTLVPIKFTTFNVNRVNDMMIVNFSTETPQDVDEFVVLWSPDGLKEHEIVIGRIRSDGITKSYTYKFLAMIYEG